MNHLLSHAVALAFMSAACSSDPLPPSCGAAGRVLACACATGSGSQECGPEGVWSACVCPDAAPPPSDASADARDVPIIDGTPAPRLYTACAEGETCGAGLECLSPSPDAGTPGLCSVRCVDREGCPGGLPFPTFVCVRGVCARNCDVRGRPDVTVCAPGLRCVAVPTEPGTIGGSRCLP